MSLRNGDTVRMSDIRPVGGEIRYIEACKLEVDRQYQRSRNESRIKEIAEHFGWRAFTAVSVSARHGGKLAIIDGQQRVAAAILRFGPHVLVPCIVWAGLSAQDEAFIFSLMNGHRGPVSAIDRFRAALCARDRDALAIASTLRTYGLMVANSDSVGSLKAIGTIQQIYQRFGSEMVDMAVRVCTRAWGRSASSVQGQVVYGIARFIQRYRQHPGYKEERLVKALAARPIAEMRRAGSEYAATLGHASTGIAMAILRAYNRGLSSNRLPEWNEEQ